MTLNNPDTRRALRSIIQAVISLVILGFVGWLIYLLQADNPSLLKIAMALLGIVGMGTLFYGAENVTRAVKAKTPFGELEIGPD